MPVTRLSARYKIASGTTSVPGEIFTFTVKNNSGSTQAANFVTKSFGLAFKDGDLSGSEYPVFELSDTTNVPYTVYGIAKWPSGYWRFAGFIARIPTSIAGSGTLTVSVKTGGSAPSSSGFSDSDITSATSLDVQMAAAQGWSGTQTSAVNTGISDGASVVIGDGPVGRVIRVMQEFNDGGSDHEHAYCFHYVYHLKNHSSGTYGFRHRAKIMHGRTDGTSSIVTLASTSLDVRNAGSSVLSMAAGQNIYTVTVSSGDSTITSAATNFFGIYCMPVVFTTTGTLPSGLTANTVYWARYAGSPTSNSIKFHDTAAEAASATNTITLATDGTGTLTMTEVPAMFAYQCGPLTSNTDGDYAFVAGGGSGSETTCDVWQDKTYLISTKLIGPRRTDIAPDALTTRSVYFDQWTEYGPNFNGTGERPEIGIIPGDAVAALLNQTQNDRKTLLAHTQQMFQQHWELRRGTGRTILNITNSSHSGLPSSQTTIYHRPSNAATSAGIKAQSSYARKFAYVEWSHQPRPQVGAYIITAEPDYLDTMNGVAISGMLTSLSRSGTADGTTYHALVWNENYARMEAWILAEISYARMFASTSHWDSVNYVAYWDEIIASNLDWMRVRKTELNSFCQTNGVRPTTDWGGSMWSESFLLMMFIQMHMASGDSDAIEALEDIAVFYEGIRANRGLYHIGSFIDSFPFTSAGQGGTGRLNLTTWDEWLPSGIYGGLTWDASTDTITYGDTSSGAGNAYDSNAGAVVNGNLIMFRTQNGVKPGGTSYETIYYIGDVNTGAKTFRLYSDSGLTSLVDITTTASLTDKSKHFGYSPSPSSSTINTESTAKGAAHKIWAALAWAKANGYTVDSTLWSEVDGRISVYEAGWASSLQADPTYLIKETY